MLLTPGAYLKCRRTAFGLSVADVVGALATDPRIAWQDRADWIRNIEADIAPASWTTIVALRQLYLFDLPVLERLSLIHLGADAPPPRLCRICGNGALSALNSSWVAPWGWAEPGVCIPCAAAD